MLIGGVTGGDTPYLLRQNFVVPVYCVSTGIVSGIVQLFLTARAGRL